jgi:tetratricopeptide (TPR) repeat protein
LYTGAIYYSRLQFDSASFYYKKAEKINDQYEKPLAESQRLYNRLGVMNYETGNYRQAKNYFEKAIEIAKKSEDYDIKKAVEWYFDIEKNYLKKAEEHYKKFKEKIKGIKKKVLMVPGNWDTPIFYEIFKDYLNTFKPYCISSNKGYYSFYTMEDLKQFLKEMGLNNKDELKNFISGSLL